MNPYRLKLKTRLRIQKRDPGFYRLRVDIMTGNDGSNHTVNVIGLSTFVLPVVFSIGILVFMFYL